VSQRFDRAPYLPGGPTQLGVLALLASAAAGIMAQVSAIPPLRVIGGLGQRALTGLGTDVSTWLLQLSGAAALIVGAVAFLAVQAGGGIVATRRPTAILHSSSAAVLCWLTLLVVIGDAIFLRLRVAVGTHGEVARAVSWSGLALVAVLAAVGAIFLEQVYFADMYRLTRYFARDITARAILDFGFVDGPPESLNIQRYNLDFRRTDPIGPLSEIFEHSIQAHDRVLLQYICDTLARRVTQAGGVPLKAEQIRAIYLNRLAGPAPRNGRRAGRAADTSVVCLYVMHFLVRNAANVRRKWRMPTGRHPFVFAALRLLRSLSPYPEYGQATDLAAEGLAAMILAAREEKQWASTEPYGAVALMAIDLWELGQARAASRLWEAYTVCRMTGNRDLFPLPRVAVPRHLGRAGQRARARVRRDPQWVPGARQSLWLQMLAELNARST
jgi:hypothetical protein